MLPPRCLLHPNAAGRVYAAYGGVIEFNDAMQQALGTGAETSFEDQYFRTAPRFETGDERYRWVTQGVFVARGRAYAGLGVEYEVYRVG